MNYLLKDFIDFVFYHGFNNTLEGIPVKERRNLITWIFFKILFNVNSITVREKYRNQY